MDLSSHRGFYHFHSSCQPDLQMAPRLLTAHKNSKVQELLRKVITSFHDYDSTQGVVDYWLHVKVAKCC
jgi:hypothetical protein